MDRSGYLVCLTVLFALPFNGEVTAKNSSKTYICQPSLENFCRNVHIGCAGVTTIRTVKFKVAISGDRALVKMDNAAQYETGQVSNDNGVLIELAESRDWIRIEQDGRYSHRIYRDEQAAMSYGICHSASNRRQRLDQR